MRAIAMKATQEDWDSVKDLIESVFNILNFKNYCYLTTNYCDRLGLVSNINNDDLSNSNRTVYETFERTIFLDALDIVEDEEWESIEIKYFDGTSWIRIHDAKVKKTINPEVKQLQELADKLGYKIEKL
jgi:hypothetical protein